MNRLLRQSVPLSFKLLDQTFLRPGCRITCSSSSLFMERFLSTKEATKQEAQQQRQDDEPVSFTQSKAFKFKSSHNFQVTEEELSYSEHTSIIVKTSVIIFLIYFGILREPNDIDEQLSRGLFEIVPDLEIPMIESELKRLEAHGINSEELRHKLEELKKLQSQSTTKEKNRQS